MIVINEIVLVCVFGGGGVKLTLHLKKTKQKALVQRRIYTNVNERRTNFKKVEIGIYVTLYYYYTCTYA